MAGLLNQNPYGGGLLGRPQPQGLLGGIANFFRPWTPEDRARVAAVMPPDLAPTQIVKGMVGGAADLAMQANQAMPWGGNYPQAIGIDPQSGTIDPSVMVPFAQNVAGMATTGSLAAPAVRNATGMGIRAYHASPHDFERFDLTKMGTGEGAQTYGRGHYVAESEAVSGKGGEYDKQFSANPRYIEVGTDRIPVPNYKDLSRVTEPRGRALYFAANVGGGGIDDAIALHKRFISATERGVEPTSFQREAGWGNLPLMRETLAELESLKAAGARPAPAKIYEVEINASPDDLLDWDKPLSEQPGMFKRLRDAGVIGDKSPPGQKAGTATGGAVVRTSDGTDTRMEDRLRAAGIKGIRYKDASSRGAEGGTSNYVVFDDNTINILKKYGIAGLTAGGAGAAMLGGSSDSASAEAPSYSTGGRF